MPKGGGFKTPQLEDFPLNTDMVEKQTGKKDKVSSNKTPKLDRSDGIKEMKEKAPKRKLPFTVGANGDQKDSDSGRCDASTSKNWKVDPGATLSIHWFERQGKSRGRGQVKVLIRGANVVLGDPDMRLKGQAMVVAMGYRIHG
uniref:Ankyrin repeat domain containing 11 n=1 Tax=Scleropages formosus TaxID=113540 RepID=A0A8C9TT51_SCLFO